MKIWKYLTLFTCCFLLFTLFACGTAQSGSGGAEPIEPADPPEKVNSATNQPGDEFNNDYVEFNSSSLNNVPPSDVLQEISYYGGGGWGAPSCPDQNLQIYHNEDIKTEPGCAISMYGCGWQDHENVSVTVVYPNGEQKTSEVKASVNIDSFNKLAVVDIWHGVLLTDPVGQYNIIVEGVSGKAEKEITVIGSTTPSVYLYSEGLYLENFKPMEQVRFFVYESDRKGTATLAGWVDFQADEHGEKQIVISEQEIASHFLEKYFYLVVGEDSGQLMPKEPTTCKASSWGIQIDSISKSSSPTTMCGSLESRLTIGDTGRVAFTDGAEMRIRSKPGLAQDILYKVPEGSNFTVLDGPECTDKISWWRVRTDDGLEGWMAEFSDRVYLLEPIP